MKLWVLGLLTLAACSDDAPGDVDAATDAPIDAEIDAPPDGGRCGADFFLTGEQQDWDSTQTNFDGVDGAAWTVRGQPSRTATTAPNGRIELCIPAAPSLVDIDHPEYVDGLFVVEPAVFQSPGQFFFLVKGIRTTRSTTFYTELGLTFDDSRGHLLVQKQGTAVPLTLAAGGTAFAVDDQNDTSWTAGNSGGLVLFANVPVGATTLAGATVGPASIPIEAGKLTITTVR